ncbi:MAG: hypothetical protein JNK66_00505 [Chitinophagales bacterium]|nr:hypothetical protein [Chitinophagales bacterium]
MKLRNSVFYYTLVFPITLFVFISSCSNPTKLLCSEWKVYDVKFNVRSTNLTTTEQRKILYQLINEFQFQFMRDSVYRVIKGYDTTLGTWNFNTKLKQLNTTIYGQTTQSDIITLNKKYFVFRPSGYGNNIEAIYCRPDATGKK